MRKRRRRSSSHSEQKQPIRLPWNLTKRQLEIVQASERYLVLVAGRRFGKTVAAIVWLSKEALSRARGLCYYVAPFRTMAKGIAWEILLTTTREIRVAVNISELSVTLFNGSRIALKGADDPETLEGVGLTAVVLDEFGRMKLAAWEKSIRPALSDKQGRVLFCGKPRGFNHLKDFYERGQSTELDRNGVRIWDGWRSWLHRSIDGFVPRADIAEAKRDLPAKVYRQEYEATFETLAGRVYDAFTRRTHVLPHAEIERRFKPGGYWNFRRVLIAIDWGFSDPGVALVLGQTALGTIYVIHEEFHRGMLVDERGWLAIYMRLTREYGADLVVADPSQPGYLKATRQHFASTDVIVRNAQNAIHEGIRRVSVAMVLRSHGTLPNGDADERPELYVSDACTNTIRELEGYVFRESKDGATEEPIDKDNHTADSLRYGCVELTRDHD